MDSISRRIDALEREIAHARSGERRWRRVAIAAALPLIGLACIAATQASSVSDVVRARRFEVVDANNRVVFLAAVGEHGGQVDLWGPAGANVVRMGANAQGGDLAMWNSRGQLVTGMYATGEGGRVETNTTDGSMTAMLATNERGPAFALADADGRPLFAAAAAEGSVGVSVRSTDGRELVAMGAAAGKGGVMRVADAAGVPVVQLASGDDGGTVTCATRAGTRAATLGVMAPDAGGSMVLYAPGGTETVTAQARTDAGAQITLGRSAEEPTVVLQTGAADAPMLSLMSGGLRLVGLGATTTGGLLNLGNASGTPVVVVGAAADADGGAMSLRGGQGQQLVRVGIDKVGAGEVAVYDGPGLRKKVLGAVSTAP
jgi:hypothetical protein